MVIAGGVEYAYDLSGVPQNCINGNNIGYATHPYTNAPAQMPSSFPNYFGNLAKADTVVITEFGDMGQCGGSYYSSVIQFADGGLVTLDRL